LCICEKHLTFDEKIKIDEETDYHIDYQRTRSGTARTNRLYLVGRQLFYDGAARQDGASVYLQPFALSEVDRTTAERESYLS